MTNDTKSQQLIDAGISVIRPVVRTAGQPSTPLLPYVPRPPMERVLLLEDVTLTLVPEIPAEKSPTKKKIPAKTMTMRQVAVLPSNVNAKSKATKRIGPVECRETGEVFFLWSHIGKVGHTFAPVVYDLAPELLVAAFQRAQDDRAAMPQELREAMGFVG